jgi:hypothetical protein
MYQVISIMTGHHNFTIWYKNVLCMSHWYLFSNSNSMNRCSIRFEQNVPIWTGGLPFTTFLVCLWDTIFIHYDRKIMFALSTDLSIHGEIRWTTVVSVMNDIFISEQVGIHLPSFEYHYSAAYLQMMILQSSFHDLLTLIFTVKLNKRL